MKAKLSVLGCLCFMVFGCASQQTENQREIIDELNKLKADAAVAAPVETVVPKIYLTPFVSGHPECDPVGKTLMNCPTDKINQRQPGESLSEFLDRENEWGFHPNVDDMPGCIEQDDNIMICSKEPRKISKSKLENDIDLQFN
jgi:hypothetical protein